MRVVCKRIRVICKITSASEDDNALLVIAGSEYTVTKIYSDTKVYNPIYDCNTWYELLETGGYKHLAAIFEIIKEDEEEYEIMETWKNENESR